MTQEPTKAQWKRRALRAEAELESIHKIRNVEHAAEYRMHREISTCKVALREIQEAIDFAREIAP